MFQIYLVHTRGPEQREEFKTQCISYHITYSNRIAPVGSEVSMGSLNSTRDEEKHPQQT